MAGLGASDISEPIRLLAGVRPDVVLYGCTSATLTHGTAFDTQLAGQISVQSGAITLTAAGSLVGGIRAVNATRVGFASPYLGEINQQAMDFMRSEGIQTVQCADIGRALGNYGQGELTPDEVFALARRADHPEAQAIVLSCTDMRSVEVIEALEQELDKPVITSNQAMMFCVMDTLAIPRHTTAIGQLFHQL